MTSLSSSPPENPRPPVARLLPSNSPEKTVLSNKLDPQIYLPQ